MNTLFAVVTGALYAAGVYMMLRRSIVKLLIGLSLLAHAANLLTFTSAGLRRAPAPIVDGAKVAGRAEVADPLPQALVLTAIVISLGLMAFAIALIHRAHQVSGSDDLSRLTGSDVSDGSPASEG